MAERTGFEPATLFEGVFCTFQVQSSSIQSRSRKVRELGLEPSWSDSQSEALPHKLPSGKIGAPADNRNRDLSLATRCFTSKLQAHGGNVGLCSPVRYKNVTSNLNHSRYKVW